MRRARVYDCLGRAGADVEPALPHFLYSVDQVVSPLTLLDEPPDADLERLPDKARVIDAGEEDHGTSRGNTGDLPRRFHTVEHGHGDVQHRNVGPVALHGVHRGPTVRFIRDDLEPAPLQQRL